MVMMPWLERRLQRGFSSIQWEGLTHPLKTIRWSREDIDIILSIGKHRLLFGVNEKLLIQHILGLVTKYKLLYVSNQGRARDKG